MNSSASRSFNHRIASFSSKNGMISFHATTNHSSKFVSLSDFHSRYKAYNFLHVSISFKSQFGCAITFRHFLELYFGYVWDKFFGVHSFTFILVSVVG
jgi:hypothetical protein